MKNAPETVADDTPEAWAVVADDWLASGTDLPDARSAKLRAAYEAWLDGGPPTEDALRYARSRRMAGLAP